jgi:hypothetical protein
MTALAHELLAEIRAAGGEVVAIGPDRLKVRAPSPLPDELMARLRAAKPDLLATLARPCAESERAGWDAADWRAYYEERGGIREYDGRRPRPDAERLAWGETQTLWHARHGGRAPFWECAGCLQPIGGTEALSLTTGERVHLRDGYDCLMAYSRRWRSAATAALIKLGLPKPRTVPEDEP